jgi:hypothetical protein
MRRSYVVLMRWMVIYGYGVPGGTLNLISTKLPRPWSPWESSPSRKNPHCRTGNQTRDLMISSSDHWTMRLVPCPECLLSDLCLKPETAIKFYNLIILNVIFITKTVQNVVVFKSRLCCPETSLSAIIVGVNTVRSDGDITIYWTTE